MMRPKNIFISLFLVVPALCNSQIINGGFETWDTTYTNVYSDILSHSFGIPDPVGGIVDPWVSSSGYGVSRTTDSYEGDYSLILHNWYGYAYEWMNYDETFNSRPLYLQGYYKYITAAINGLPHATMNVSLTWYNGSIVDTIARGTHTFDSVSIFSPFTISLNYVSLFIPDSIHIYIINADRACDTSIVCNFLYLDDIELSDFPSDLHQPGFSNKLVTVYPNPTSSIFNLQLHNDHPVQFSLFNSLGIMLLSKHITDKTESIDLSSYPPDVYYYKAINENDEVDIGKIIKQ